MLKKGDKLEGKLSGPVSVGKLLGTGGQGAVYEGRTAGGRSVAIKWYLPNFQQPDLRESIGQLVDKKAPSDHFLWPDDIVSRGSEFGYVMRLRPHNFVSLSRILSRQVTPTFRELLRAASETVTAFKALQATGLFYCDISDGNLFVDPGTGDVLICDNDNVGSTRTRPRVLGTPRYMAPEIVRGEKEPSALTDAFSMAVLLFLLLFNDHPLQGAAESRIRCFDAHAMKKLYGHTPVFIFDPHNDSNRPMAGIHVNAPLFWNLYPQALRDVFTQVFTEGMFKPGERPAFRDWQLALDAVEDSIVLCQSCGRQNFAHQTAPDVTCWKCGHTVRPAFRLVIGRRVIALSAGSKLYERHVARSAEPAALGSPKGEVVKHPTKGHLGIKNLGPSQWYFRVDGGLAKSVEPGRSVTLRTGTEIEFGEVTGVVES